MYNVYHEELTTLQFLFIKNSDIHMHGTRQRGHSHHFYDYAEQILEKVVYDILVLYFGTKFPMQISISMLVISYSLEIWIQRSVIISFGRNYTKLYVAYYWLDYCVIIDCCTLAPPAPLLR